MAFSNVGGCDRRKTGIVVPLTFRMVGKVPKLFSGMLPYLDKNCRMASVQANVLPLPNLRENSLMPALSGTCTQIRPEGLTDSSIEAIRHGNLVLAAINGASYLGYFHQNKSGLIGGFVEITTSISPGAEISISSSVWGKSEIGEGCFLLKSNVVVSSRITGGSRLFDSEILNCAVEKGSYVEKSYSACTFISGSRLMLSTANYARITSSQISRSFVFPLVISTMENGEKIRSELECVVENSSIVGSSLFGSAQNAIVFRGSVMPASNN